MGRRFIRLWPSQSTATARAAGFRYKRERASISWWLPPALARQPSPESVERLFAITRAFWIEWMGYCRYDGPYRDIVMRSASR
jgi:hypothetical protein